MTRFRMSALSFCPALALALAAVAPSAALAQPTVEGKWSDVFKTKNVMIHASLLPDGKLLYWSRREGDSLDEHECTPRIWDRSKGMGDAAFSETANKPGYNLFCSGHTILPDGRVFVVGGHLTDFHGSTQATIYDPGTNRWTSIADTKDGRWYPTAVTLADGGVLVSFGATKDGHLNPSQQIWKDGTWTEIANFDPPPLYPRMHVISDGRVFMSGPLALTQYLETRSPSHWTFLHPDPDINRAVDLSSRLSHLLQEYAPSVLYDQDKILFVGGGNGPIQDAEILDLSQPSARWVKTGDMHFKRRQHNATLLPDGTVVVMGGTQGDGFDNVTQGQPIRSAELWDPKTGHWTKLAKAAVDRCYHSTAVLLPDATVLSAGGGEFRPNPGEPFQVSQDGHDHENLTKDTHKDAQIFSPPYLFRGGTRLVITSAPTSVTYGATFTVGTSTPNNMGQVNWVRLSSVTHSFNSNQRINFLKFRVDAGALKVTAPANANLCPPGHYMLFILDKNNVPSVAKVVNIH